MVPAFSCTHSPHPTDHFLAHNLPALKSSLSHTLRLFHPFSGRLRRGPGGRSLEISYVGGQDSVPFTVAESNDDFHQLCSDHPRHSSRLTALTPRLPRCNASGSVPLLAVQATVFPGTGLSLGFSSHHIASDDLSFMHFVRTWASANKLDGTAPPPPPCYDRALVADPNDLCSKYLDSMLPPPSPADQHALATETDVFFASFTLKRDDIERLKRKALARAGVPFHCTSFVVTLALAWVSLFHAQGRAATDGKRAHAGFPADCRGRVKPPLPAEYFGNCQCPCLIEVSMDDLLGEDGFAAAAEAIGRTIEGLAAAGGLDVGIEKVFSLLGERPMSVSGSPRTGVYGVDLGWGKPLKVEVTSIGDSTMSLSESRDETGGTEIGLAMPVQEMDEFRSRFFDGLRG